MSVSRRNGSGALARVRGEIVSEPRRAPVASVARPLPPSADGLDEFFRDVAPQVVEIHHHHAPAAESSPPGLRWDRVLIYVFGLIMLAVFIALLVASGLLSLSVPSPPWQSGSAFRMG